MVNDFAREFGPAGVGPRELVLVRQASAIAVRCETLQAHILRGDDIDLEQLTRLSNVAVRVLTELGIKATAGPKTPTLKEYIAAKQAETAQ
jgi:hypothetical protein